MQNPYGLAVSGERLFVCDGQAGLKSYYLKNPTTPALIQHHHEFECDDLIILDNKLIAVSPNGFNQYDITNYQLELLSEI